MALAIGGYHIGSDGHSRARCRLSSRCLGSHSGCYSHSVCAVLAVVHRPATEDWTHSQTSSSFAHYFSHLATLVERRSLSSPKIRMLRPHQSDDDLGHYQHDDQELPQLRPA